MHLLRFQPPPYHVYYTFPFKVTNSSAFTNSLSLKELLTHTHRYIDKHIFMAKFRLLLSLLFVFFTVLSVVLGQGSGRSNQEMVPALFIFGDSLIDNGNNNDLPSFAKANYFP